MTTHDEHRPRTSIEWEQASRRTWPRVSPPSISCDLGQLVDISLTGAMIRTKKKLREPLTIRIAAPGACLGLSARIVWHRPICFRDHEYGLEFVRVAPKLRLMLQDLLGAAACAAVDASPDAENPVQVLDPQLEQLVRLWPHLEEAQRQSIIAFLRAA